MCLLSVRREDVPGVTASLQCDVQLSSVRGQRGRQQGRLRPAGRGGTESPRGQPRSSSRWSLHARGWARARCTGHQRGRELRISYISVLDLDPEKSCLKIAF